MPGGYIQLNRKGIEDAFFLKNPSISYFKAVYMKYTNFSKNLFSLIPEEIDFGRNRTNEFAFEKKYHIKIPKNGDLIKDLYLKTELPKIFCLNSIYHDVKWVDNLEFKIVKEVDIRIGGRTIQIFDSDFIYNQYMLHRKNELKNIFDELHNYKNFSTIKNDTTPLDSESYVNLNFNSGFSNNLFNIYTPIPVWFTNQAFPIRALEYMDIDVYITLNPINELLLIRKKNIVSLTDELEVNIDPYIKLEDVSDYNNIVDLNYNGYNLELITNYIFLEKDQYETYTNQKIIIETYNKKMILNTKKQRFNYIYETFGPTIDLTIIPKRTDIINFNDHFNFTKLENRKMDIRKNTNHIFNIVLEQYKYNLKNNIESENAIDLLKHFVLTTDETHKILDKTIFTLLYSNVNNDIIIDFNNSITYDDIYNFREYWKFRNIVEIPSIDNDNYDILTSPIINNLKIKYNGMIREDTKTNFFNTNVSKFKTYDGLESDIPIYSFSLDPSNIQPSGHCNFSYINKTELIFELSEIKDEVDYSYNISIYNRYYNILDLNSGMANLLFFK